MSHTLKVNIRTPTDIINVFDQMFPEKVESGISLFALSWNITFALIQTCFCLISGVKVDIDIKIRVCKGSCKQTFDHAIDNEAYEAMENKMKQFSIISKRRKSFSRHQKLKLQPIDRPRVSQTYRKIPIVRTELLTKFEDIEQNQMVLDELLEDI